MKAIVILWIRGNKIYGSSWEWGQPNFDSNDTSIDSSLQNKNNNRNHTHRKRPLQKLWPFEFKNLKNVIMKYQASVAEVGVLCKWVCPDVGGVCVYQVWSLWDSRGWNYEEKYLRVLNSFSWRTENCVISLEYSCSPQS
jgi:hypothetical protein